MDRFGAQPTGEEPGRGASGCAGAERLRGGSSEPPRSQRRSGAMDLSGHHGSSSAGGGGCCLVRSPPVKVCLGRRSEFGLTR